MFGEFVQLLPGLGLTLNLLVLTLLVSVVIALLRAPRQDIVKVIEAAAKWLPWRRDRP